MLLKNVDYTKKDLELIKVLNDFLPDKIFDAHAHLFDSRFLPNVCSDVTDIEIGNIEEYKKSLSPILCNPKELRLNIIPFPDKSMSDDSTKCLELSDFFLISQLNFSSDNVGEIIVRPTDAVDDIEKRICHPNIRGMKCYHYIAKKENTLQLPIDAYLPESAWEVANKHKMCITLHMVKDKALSDSENLDYICKMAKKYPDAILILAHAARSFAAWTAIESIDKVAKFDNVWYDFSGVCECPAMLKILQKVGVGRCIWGSDYPVSNIYGKAISLADTFYWLYKSDFNNQPALFDTFTTVGIENLMSIRHACILAELKQKDIEDLFYNNAMQLFKPLT